MNPGTFKMQGSEPDKKLIKNSCVVHTAQYCLVAQIIYAAWDTISVGMVRNGDSSFQVQLVEHGGSEEL